MSEITKSAVRRLTNGNEQSFVWMRPTEGPSRLYVVVVGIGNSILGGSIIVKGFVDMPLGPFDLILLLVFLILAAIGVVFTFTFAAFLSLLRTAHPACISLTPTHFRFDSGTYRPSMEMISRLSLTDWKSVIFQRRKKIEIWKSDFGGLSHDRQRTRHQLFLDHDGKRIEIGRHLSNEDQAWIAKIILDWQVN